MAKSNVLEIEVDGSRNESLFFRPLQRAIRGRCDLNRVSEPQARMKAVEWPESIPGLRLGLDFATSTGYVAEPLHEPANAANKQRILSRGFGLAPEREEFPAADVPTWLFWLKRAVESGAAKVTKGELPESIEGEPQKSFITTRVPNPTDRLAAAIEANTKILATLLERMSK